MWGLVPYDKVLPLVQRLEKALAMYMDEYVTRQVGIMLMFY